MKNAVPADNTPAAPSGRPGEGHAHAAGALACAVPTQPLAVGPGVSQRAHGTDELPAVPGYTVLRVLGRGGMGVVFLARQEGLDRLVALKMILHAEHAGAEERRRFGIEAEAVARLQHPHIVQLHEFGEHGGKPWFALEFMEGGSLDAWLASTPVAARLAAAIVRALADAMHYAHQQGVVHRDLKPANVLLTAQGLPKITDFGLAKQLDQQTGQPQTGTILGTPSYMAPEQADGTRTIGPHTDVYALGAILYEMLTGRPPFRGATPFDTVLMVGTEEPVPPGNLFPKCPRDLETICLKCLRKEPGQRYASAGQLAEDLRRFAVGEPVAARPVGAWERLLRWAWSRR
jgi:eukaryotic-like serine/threonine-protein kinase